jgi:hypothetical protein
MARYLERLVARAGVGNDAAPAVPSPHLPFERQMGDPFENTAAWNSDPAQPGPVSVASFANPVVPQPPVEPAPRSPVIVERTTELRVEEHWAETASPLPIVRPTAVEPVSILKEEIVREIELQPHPAMPAREIHTESTRVENSLERETVRTETLQPAAAREEPAALSPGDIERGVLEKLMPALDEWFRSGVPAPAEDTPQPPLVPSRQRDREIVAPPTAEASHLVIGSIRVEVTSPPAPVVANIPPRRAARSSPAAGRPSPSRLGFGLGQM